jgi:beta-1,4-mannooligosaccharide/beta-1,4-mannosyl-N-acetylglucosamine phosphorylase
LNYENCFSSYRKSKSSEEQATLFTNYRSNSRFNELFRRAEGNPILTASDWPYLVNAVFNPGAIRLSDGHTLLLARVEDRTGISHLTAARSQDGMTNWQIDPQPTYAPDPTNYPEEEWGVEDARIVYLTEREQYAVTYTAYSARGPLVSLALTRDFKTFERRGMLKEPEDKDAALFPRRIGGKWVLIHRPVMTGSRADIHLSFSVDLQHWSDSSVLLASRRGNWWDANKIGLSSPPIETVEGWLLIYHGVRVTGAGVIYRVGLALLDLEDPRRIIRRGDEWVMSPREPYEIIGDVGYVVFPCGQVVDEVTGELRLYYGAADSSIAVAHGNIDEMLDWLMKR